MGRVWRATDVVLHREVAIKELVPPPGLTPDERREMRERSLREARAIARLNNINVVRVFDVLRTDADPWIVMEYVPSRSLQDVLASDGPVPAVRAAEIGIGMLNALRAAHRNGVVHRDVKPGNVLIGEDGRVVLTDFGLATVPGDPTVTRTGLVLGSPAYIAPERARDGTAGPAADLWSLGATLYAAVEGASPFARPTAIATLAALATENPPPARNAGPLKPVLNGLLRKDPTHRINAEEAERLLLRASGRRSRLALPMSPTMRRPSAGRQRPALSGTGPPPVVPGPTASGSAPVVPGPRPPVSTGRPPGTSLPPARPSGAPVSPSTGTPAPPGRPPVFIPGKASVARPAADTPARVDGPKVEPPRLDATRVDPPPVRDGEPAADKDNGIPGTGGGARETTGQRGERATSAPASVSANGALARGTRGVYGTIPPPEAAADLARRSPEASVTAPDLERPADAPAADPSRGTGPATSAPAADPSRGSGPATSAPAADPPRGTGPATSSAADPPRGTGPTTSAPTTDRTGPTTSAPAADASRGSGQTTRASAAASAPPAETSSPGGPIPDSAQRAEPRPATESAGKPTTAEARTKEEPPVQATPAVTAATESVRRESDKAETVPATAESGQVETNSAKAGTNPAESTPAQAEKVEPAPAGADKAKSTPAEAERAETKTAAAERAAAERAAAETAESTRAEAERAETKPTAAEAAAADKAEPAAESSGPLTTGKAAATKPAVGARAGAHGSKSARKKGRTARNAAKPHSAGVFEPTTAKAEAAEPTTAKAEAAEPTTASVEAAEPTMTTAQAAEPTKAEATKAEPTKAEPTRAATGENETAAGRPGTTDQPEQAAEADARSAEANATVVELLQKADAPPRKRVAAAAPGRKVTTAAVDTPAPSGQAGTDSAAGTAVINVPAARTEPSDKFAAPSRPAWQPMTVPPRDELQRGVTIFGTTLTRRQTTVGAVILLVLVLLLVFLVPRAFGDGGGGENTATGGGLTVAPTGSAASTGKASSAPAVPPAATTAPATPSSAPPKTSAAAAAVPAGWYLYQDRSGFSVPLPDGVRPTGSTSELRFRWNNRLLILAQTDKPQPDPFKDWQQQERERAGAQYRNYRKIKLERVDYFQSAADWEFTYTTENGNEQHALKRNFLTSDTQAYSINWYTTPGDWNAAKKDLQVIYQGFKPRK